MDSPPMFNSVEDECRYWKERAKLYHKEWTDVKQEFDEYVEQSRQMEAEMDATLEQKQNAIKDLRLKVSILEKENDSLRMKQDSHIIEFANVEKQLETVKNERDSMKQYLRQLEQKNDDLERAHRILNESIADFEAMLDKAYEKNALLEMEVDEKEMLQEKLQRLMDETRDLKQELNVKTRYPSTTPNGVAENSVLSENLSNPTNATTIPTGNSQSSLNEYNQNSLKNPDNMLNGNAAAMTASSRTTALNIVADMLRKLNLDKTLLCSRCSKFRCICKEMNALQDGSNVSNTSCSSNRTSMCFESTNNNNNRSFSSPNIFKRFAQRFSGDFQCTLPSTTSSNSTIDEQDNAMETKLKAYREQPQSMQPRQ